MRTIFPIVLLVVTTFGFAQEPSSSSSASLRFDFESKPLGQLVGQAAIDSTGPTAENYVGLPDRNQALQLDGNGDFLRLTEEQVDFPLDFDQGDPITLEAWVQLDSIGGGQNVYVIGKGRTQVDPGKHGRDNQNYALRLRATGGQAKISFLFRSRSDEQHSGDWHRWTSNTGFGPGKSWHHLAVSYRFGEPESIRGYIDGKAVKGKWDMGGATQRPPVVDDDQLWIGASMGGAAGSSLKGGLDDVVLHRSIVDAGKFKNRRIAITHPPAVPKDGLPEDRVRVAIYENVGSNADWPEQLPSPLADYSQSAFGISRIPAPYAKGGVRRDWKGPSMIQAMAEIDLPDHPLQWMIRAGGLTRLWIGDEVIVETPPHLGPTSGHGEVQPYTEEDPWLRPLRAGHHERIVTHQTDPGKTVITLQTMIGGSGMRYEPGEILVAVRADEADPWQLLGLQQPVPLSDAGWQRYAPQHRATVQAVEDKLRRASAADQDEQWRRRHRQAASFVAALPSLPAELTDIDAIIDDKIQAADRRNEKTLLTSDEAFLRRLTLDCLGVIPSDAQLEYFRSLKGSPAERRRQMIDYVLADPQWAGHWTAYWMDVLAENASVLKPTLNNTGPFRWFLHDMLRDNVAIDRWVTTLLQMEGSKYRGGAAGFAMATENDVPIAAKAHVAASAFLGVNMKCARCHDAPFHDWKQRQLFELAAMLKREPIDVPASSSVPAEFFAGEEAGTSLITLSISPGEKIQPAWSLDRLVSSDKQPKRNEWESTSDTRARFAYQVTRVENRRFAKVIVNRLWKQLIGEAIVEPVDDWEGVSASHPQLLDFLARELAANRFDFKHVTRLILNSETYQRQSVDRPIERDRRERLFASPRLRRMTAEQIVDSMHVAVGREMDAGELTFDPKARMRITAQNHLGKPRRAWQLTSLSNERDRPALSLPKAAAVAECLEAFGWTGSRQEPINHREEEPNVLQPGVLANGVLSIQLTRATDGDAVTKLAVEADSVDSLVESLFLRFLTRKPTERERQRFSQLLSAGFEDRISTRPPPPPTPIRYPNVSWANHLHPRATEVRLQQTETLRHGPPPTGQLQDEWRRRLEDTVWALLNTPEFVFVP